MNGFINLLYTLPLLCALYFIANMVVKIDWDIPLYKKIFIATMAILALSFTLRTLTLYSKENYDRTLTLMYFDNFATLCVIPFLFWFGESLTIEKKRFDYKNILQFLPALVIGGMVVVLGCILKQDHTAREIIDPHPERERFSTQWWFHFFNTTLIDIALIIQVVYTAIAATIHIDRFRRDAKKYYSELCESGYRHFLRILILIIVLLILLYSTKILARTYTISEPGVAMAFSSIACSIVVVLLFHSVNKIDFSADNVASVKEHLSIGNDNNAQDSEPEISQELEGIRKSLEKWSSDPSKPYLKQRITLEDLSNDIGYNGKSISAFLNKIEKMTFFNYIAKLRVTEAKRLLLSPDNYSLTYIALECGFSDAPNFSRSFRNIEGMTPGTWKKKNLSTANRQLSTNFVSL